VWNEDKERYTERQQDRETGRQRPGRVCDVVRPTVSMQQTDTDTQTYIGIQSDTKTERERYTERKTWTGFRCRLSHNLTRLWCEVPTRNAWLLPSDFTQYKAESNGSSHELTLTDRRTQRHTYTDTATHRDRDWDRDTASDFTHYRTCLWANKSIDWLVFIMLLA